MLGTGDVVGDILFGSAPVNVDPNAQNKLIIEGSVTRHIGGNVTTDRLRHRVRFRPPDGRAARSMSKSPGLGTGGILRTSNVRGTSLTVGANGTAQFALTQNTGSDPLVATTGDISFETNSTITITPTSFLPANGTYTLLRSSRRQRQFHEFRRNRATGSGSPIPVPVRGHVHRERPAAQRGLGQHHRAEPRRHAPAQDRNRARAPGQRGGDL